MVQTKESWEGAVGSVPLLCHQIAPWMEVVVHTLHITTSIAGSSPRPLLWPFKCPKEQSQAAPIGKIHQKCATF